MRVSFMTVQGRCTMVSGLAPQPGKVSCCPSHIQARETEASGTIPLQSVPLPTLQPVPWVLLLAPSPPLPSCQVQPPPQALSTLAQEARFTDSAGEGSAKPFRVRPQ